MAQLNQTPTMIAPPPNTDDISQIRGYVANLAEILAKLAKDLDYIINGNLDVNNVRANSITAVAMDVQELSAITANLGTITAGTVNAIDINSSVMNSSSIFGSLIATSVASMPRIELSSTNNLLKAENNQGGLYQAVEIVADDSLLGFPSFHFNGPTGIQHRFYNLGDSLTLDGTSASSSLTVTHRVIYLGNFGGSTTIIRGNVRRDGSANIGSSFVPLSSASDVDELRGDYNTLVSALKTMGIIA